MGDYNVSGLEEKGVGSTLLFRFGKRDQRVCRRQHGYVFVISSLTKD